MARSRSNLKSRQAQTATVAAPLPQENAWWQRDWLLALTLAAITLAVFFPSIFNNFVLLDDDVYVTNNPEVKQGLTGYSIWWAFNTSRFGHWLPLTWLSHMLDVQLYGLDPHGHHATNVVLHAANAGLAFLVLSGLTGSRWRSFAAAAVFALHPLRVESVTWVSDRKDLLCGLFFFLTLLAYQAYARKPSILRYLLTLLLYALGLMAKSMIVTLPALLLLLDWWPLRRLAWQAPAPDNGDAPANKRSIGLVIAEKVPMLLMAAAASAAIYITQEKAGAMEALASLTLSQRLANAVVSVWRYVGKMLLPIDLSPWYPHPGSWPMPAVLAATLGLLIAIALVVKVARRRPWLFVGWFWFLGMLVPVSGIVQISGIAIADRFTYLPTIGLAIVITWAAVKVGRRSDTARGVVAIVGGSLLVVLMSVTIVYELAWKNDLSLFEHAVAVDEDNWMAHDHVGKDLYDQQDYENAAVHLKRSLELRRPNIPAQEALAVTYQQLGNFSASIAEFRDLIAQRPNAAEHHAGLAFVLTRSGDFAAADTEYARALQLQPNNPEMLLQWAVCLMREGKRDEAAEKADAVLRLAPDNELAKKILQAAIQGPR